MTLSPPGAEFGRHFALWKRSIRTRQTLGWLLTGFTYGAVCGAAATLAAWWFGAPTPVFAVASTALGVGFGWVLARRRRWSDGEIALYLDGKLGSNELISTAAEHEEAAPNAASRWIASQATTALRAATPAAHPRVVLRRHALGAIAVLATVGASFAPPRPSARAAAVAPKTDRITNAAVPGLDRITALERATGVDPEQTRRLRAIANRARKLREELARGLERREALSKLSELRDAIAAERLPFADNQHRPGLDAAIRELESRKSTAGAAKALGEGDLVELDEQMQRLANELEQSHRREAKDALDAAARQARERGARGLAEALDRQRADFEKREASARALRELAEALQEGLSEEAKRDLEEFGETGSPEAGRRLAESLEQALSKLSAEERKRLAERLKRGMSGSGDAMSPLTREQIEELARRLESEDAREHMLRSLQELAKPNSDAERDRALDGAERGTAEAQRELGGAVPVPGGNGGSPQAGSGKAGAGSPGPGGGSPTRDGATDAVPNAGSVVSKAETKMNRALPMHGASLGRAPSRPGETANQLGSGAIGSAGPGEVGAVERSDVPEEYRDQVGRYFEP
jgi:hypothetical protein